MEPIQRYNPNDETELHCDASSSGFGAILFQRKKDLLFHPVFYFSKRTTDVESRYHSFELETLAIIYALRRFRVYLHGINFKILTDCNSLTLTLKKKEINPRIARWALELENFQYTLEHRAGSKMAHVDSLSRCTNILALEANSFERSLAVSQDRDPVIVELKKRLENEENEFYEMRNGLLYRKSKDKVLFVVPFSMRTNVIRTCHDDVGHVGIDKTVELIKRFYWFPKLKLEVVNHIQNCLKCIEFSPNDQKRSVLHNIDKGTKPFDTIHIDHYGPLNENAKHQKYILVVIDAFTRYVKLYATKTTSTREVIICLKNYFEYFGSPFRLVSDRGTSFTSGAFREFLESLDIKHVLVATASPRSNGQVERMNRFLTPILAKLTDDQIRKDWSTVLRDVEFVFNNTYCRSINTTPSKMLFGIDQRDRKSHNLKLFLEESQIIPTCINEIRDSAIKKNLEVQAYNKVYNDKKCKPRMKYRDGQLVMIRNIARAGVSKKLAPKFKGPYIVKKVLDNDRYVVCDPEGFQVSQIPFEGIFDPTNMRSWLMESPSEVNLDDNNLDIRDSDNDEDVVMSG